MKHGGEIVWVWLFSDALSWLSRSQFESVILRCRNVVALALFTVVKGHLVLEVAAGAKSAQP